VLNNAYDALDADDADNDNEAASTGPPSLGGGAHHIAGGAGRLNSFSQCEIVKGLSYTSGQNYHM